MLTAVIAIKDFDAYGSDGRYTHFQKGIKYDLFDSDANSQIQAGNMAPFENRKTKPAQPKIKTKANGRTNRKKQGNR